MTNTNISVPRAVLSQLIDMASDHASDIQSGIEEGIYSASENADLEQKLAVITHAQFLIEPCRSESQDMAEVFPGACIQEVGSVMMQDIVGHYEDPVTVPEWVWVMTNASFAHVQNGQPGGVWEYVLNLARDLGDVPDKLKPVMAEARAKGLAYVIFHQGT